MNPPELPDRIRGCLWGAVIGDALGVPVEFKSREELRREPVRHLRGGGAWHQPPGTWSNDSSLLLCTTESLLHGFNPDDMARRFVAWMNAECWTPWGSVFDIGLTTRQALQRVIRGVPAEGAGGEGERDNGNGALVRILPVALRYWHEGEEGLLHRVHRVAAITHRHPRSQIACGLYSLMLMRVMAGVPKDEAACEIAQDLAVWYDRPPFADERAHFEPLADREFVRQSEDAINSSPYVVHTLTAAVWSVLSAENFTDAVLRAVNLGGDANTTATVAGGLAGGLVGEGAIPDAWRGGLARKDDLAALFTRFTNLCAREAPV